MGNQTVQRLLRDGVIQAKLTVNQPGDRFEQEADRVAEQVMRMPDARHGILRGASLGIAEPRVRATPPIQRMCSECEKEVHRKETGAARPASADVRIPRGSGVPLPASVRSFFEPRFGQDFGNVRIHTSRQADESARSLSAVAYTAGSDIVFADGRYSPQTAAGKRLLAHELTHVAQQRSAGGMIQRVCKDAVAPTPGCTPDPRIPPPARKFLFNVDCDDFAPGEQAAMEAFASGIAPTATVGIVGLASADGPADLNDRLSCSRAERGRAVIRASAPAGVRIASVDATGGIPATEHDPTMRAVGVTVTTPPRRRRPQVVKPGPRTPCERNCEFDFQDCLRGSNPLDCLAQRSNCLRGCIGARPAFEVCARLLQPPVEVSGCNHAYVETPTKRYAIITPCTSQASFADPINGGVAIKTDRSPDPCSRRPTCIECVPKPGFTDLESCFRSQFTVYAAPSLHKILGPNSNTFAGTLARACCDNMTPKPAAFGCLRGWDDAPAPARSAPCPSGPPVC